MDKYQIMALMMREDHQVLHTDLYSISALMAERLAGIADRLSDSEMDTFIDIGAAVYRAGLSEFGTSVPVEDLFPASENWPNGPCPERGGFRNRH
jgi:hypothetical protein